ncbi:hypothetical protein BDQ12DRAFT_726168 [Crucibulum laeve]|uniref:Rhodopsin domain-containing protein n=1 Tax=Crucibulum laeve TaxID=68775 RepID=A0A5C3LQ59_9AGAR|nr:hypothetical protein BDQ12DRAFT_726168 [Crucibulum laeve]
MIPAQPYLPWKVVITILHVIAASTSVLRVDYRRRTRRLWWDDYAAIVPAVFECVKIAIIWLRLRSFDQSEDSRQLKVALSFMNQTCFGIIIWWSRISLALAVVRITPVGSKARPWVIGLTCAFILNFIAIVLGMTVTCAMSTAWQYAKGNILICGPSYGVNLASVITDIVGDLLLVGFPMYRLRCLKLQSAQRRLVLLVFSTSVLTLVAVVAVAIVSYGSVFKGPGALLVWVMTLNIEEVISVIACNLPVLVCWGYRTFSSVDDDASGDHVTPHWSGATTTFMSPDISGKHSQTFDNVAEKSASDVSFTTRIGMQGGESDTKVQKDTIV